MVDVSLRKSQRTRARILDAAAHVFRLQGYGARLSDIAAEAGIQTGSLYYHFDGRERLVEEVLRLGVEVAWQHVRDALDALPRDSTAGQRLETAIRAHAAACLEISDYTAANSRIFSMAGPEARGRHYVLQRRYGDYFQELLEAAVRSGELRSGLDLGVVRMLLFGAMNWTAEWYRPDSGRPPQVVIDQLVTLVLDGLREPVAVPGPQPSAAATQPSAGPETPDTPETPERKSLDVQ
jgi:AcrR family transcriptional regulator